MSKLTIKSPEGGRSGSDVPRKVLIPVYRSGIRYIAQIVG